ncbi:MAG: YihY/virulence factor BrkB family protein [Jiangellaceae bacterium]
MKAAWKRAREAQLPLVSAGVAFYAFLAIVPTMIAVVLLYGLVSDPEDVERQLESFGTALPDSAAELLTSQLESIAGAEQRSLGIGLVVALGFALWSASGGIANLIKAVNVAYGTTDERNVVRRRLMALGLTLAAIVFVVAAVALVAVVPAVLNALDLPDWLHVVVEVGRWVGLVVTVLLALAVLYRVGPDRADGRFQWFSVGAIVALVLWLAASVGFSVFVDNFGSYAQTYGPLAGVVVLLLWLWLAIFATLFGAEINAVLEDGFR